MLAVLVAGEDVVVGLEPVVQGVFIILPRHNPWRSAKPPLIVTYRANMAATAAEMLKAARRIATVESEPGVNNLTNTSKSRKTRIQKNRNNSQNTLTV